MGVHSFVTFHPGLLDWWWWSFLQHISISYFYLSYFLILFFSISVCLHQTDIKGWPWNMHICRLQSDLETNKNLVEICTGITLCYVYMHPEAEIASKIINVWYHITLYYSSISLMLSFLPEMPLFFMHRRKFWSLTNSSEKHW